MRQKAIDLLYAMCDHSNSETIVAELLQYLEKADYSIREPLVSGHEYITSFTPTIIQYMIIIFIMQVLPSI